jgi:hypothetical protein
VGKRFADQAFGCTIPIHLGGVDEGHSQIDARAECRDLVGAATASLAPSSSCPGRARGPHHHQAKSLSS